MLYAKIRYELRDETAVLMLDDQATLNAMSDQLIDELQHALDRASAEARAMVIGTTGRAFCSGGNLAAGGFDLDDPMRDAGARLERAVNPFILAMRQSPLPIVTAVRGAVAGVGCGIALAGDLVIASETAFFFQAFAKVGLTPDGGSTYFLTHGIGRVRAMELMLLGGRLPAPRALEWGLINRVVPDAELDETAQQIAGSLAKGPRSLSMIKASARSALEVSLKEQLDVERVWQREAGRTKDFVEGVRSFRENRPPAFVGE